MSGCGRDFERLPIVGREQERGMLREALQAARCGHGRTVFVLGEDGMGKSWLALEAAALGRSLGMAVLHGRGSRTGPCVELRPLAEAVAGFRRGCAGHGTPCPAPYGTLLGGPMRSPLVAGEEILCLASGNDHGCLLILEDLHDADPLTLAVVEYLADNLGSQAMTVLGTVGHEPGPAWDLAHLLAQRRSAALVPLAGFDLREVRLLVASHLDVDPDRIPDEAVRRLWADSDGNPFVAGELLSAMVRGGLLAADGTACRYDGEICLEIPVTVGRSLTQRAARFGPSGQRLLLAAAAIGQRFPLSVLQRVLSMSEHGVRAHLRAAVANGLLLADTQAEDWYLFRNPMAVAALLGQQTPADRAAVADKAVAAIEELHPGLPGEWCRFAADLLATAGHPIDAARVLARAGARATAGGSADVAADLLERAWALLDDTAGTDLRADVLADLLAALADCGRVGRGLQLGEAVEGLFDAGTDPARMSTLHARLAWLAHVGGRYPLAMDQVQAARTMLGAQASDRDTASVDAIEALLTTHQPGRAARAADRAADRAESAGCPTVASQAWLARGLLARSRGTGNAARCFGRAFTLAANNRLPLWRLYARYLLGEEEWLATGDIQALQRADASARRMGADAVHLIAIARCALDHVMCGDYAAGEELAGRHLPEAQRLGLTDAARELLAVRVVSAAHQNLRLDPGQLPVEVRRTPIVIGLGDAVRSLLEENRCRARQELADAAARDNRQPRSLPLAGQHGLALLLAVLDRDGDQARHEAALPVAGRWWWDKQFALLARAVLLGRCGRGEEAVAAVAKAGVVAHRYPMTRNLGLRLVAEAAHTDRWGDPETWLRTAEAFFRDAAAPAVSGACRSLLRRVGVVVPNRRSANGIPAPLRLAGVTQREYEVLRLLAERMDNRGIAARLFISPRTVEKHVASLMAKTAQPRRAALNDYAARVLGR